MEEPVDTARNVVGKPLTLSAKVLYNYFWEASPTNALKSGNNYIDFVPDYIVCLVRTVQVTLLPFMQIRSI